MNNETKLTLDYYNSKADVFVSDTSDVEFSTIQNEFVQMLPAGGHILDLGCGSGRDSKAFINKGFKVTALDGSEELCKIAEKTIGQPVVCALFQDFETDEMYDGIWACASLLHLQKEDVIDVIAKVSGYLKEGGIFYLSFKYGTFSGERNGRYFTDMTEESFASILNNIDGLSVIEQHISSDVRPGREDEKWLNIYLKKI